MKQNRILSIAAGVLMLALAALVVVSVERTAWLFGLFELLADRNFYGRLLAWVAELAVVSLIVAKVVINRDAHEREYRYLLIGLLAALGLQVLGNLIAGFDRGWQAINDLFTAPGDGAPALFGRAVAVVAWFISNAIVPALTFILAELLSLVVRLMMMAGADRPSLMQLLCLIDMADQETGGLIRAERQHIDDALAAARLSAAEAREAAAKVAALAQDQRHQMLASIDEARQAAQAEAARVGQLSRQLEQIQGGQLEQAQASMATINQQARQLEQVQHQLATVNKPSPINASSVIAWLAEGHTLAELAAEAVNQTGGNEAAGRIFGVSGNAVKAWIRNGATE